MAAYTSIHPTDGPLPTIHPPTQPIHPHTCLRAAVTFLHATHLDHHAVALALGADPRGAPLLGARAAAGLAALQMRDLDLLLPPFSYCYIIISFIFNNTTTKVVFVHPNPEPTEDGRLEGHRQVEPQVVAGHHRRGPPPPAARPRAPGAAGACGMDGCVCVCKDKGVSE